MPWGGGEAVRRGDEEDPARNGEPSRRTVIGSADDVPAADLYRERGHVVPLRRADARQQGNIQASCSLVLRRLLDKRKDLVVVEPVLRLGEHRHTLGPTRPPGVSDHLLEAQGAGAGQALRQGSGGAELAGVRRPVEDRHGFGFEGYVQFNELRHHLWSAAGERAGAWTTLRKIQARARRCSRLTLGLHLGCPQRGRTLGRRTQQHTTSATSRLSRAAPPATASPKRVATISARSGSVHIQTAKAISRLSEENRSHFSTVPPWPKGMANGEDRGEDWRGSPPS